MNMLFPMLVFIYQRLASLSHNISVLFDSPCYPTCLFKHHDSSSPFHLKALQYLPRLSFCWNGFSTSSTYQLPLTHLITWLEIWCFPWPPWLLLSFYYAFSNHLSSMPFCLIPPSQVSGETFFFPTLISSPPPWYHSSMFSNHFSADSSEILLPLPAFPFRLKCRPLAVIPSSMFSWQLCLVKTEFLNLFCKALPSSSSFDCSGQRYHPASYSSLKPETNWRRFLS